MAQALCGEWRRGPRVIPWRSASCFSCMRVRYRRSMNICSDSVGGSGVMDVHHVLRIVASVGAAPLRMVGTHGAGLPIGATKRGPCRRRRYAGNFQRTQRQRRHGIRLVHGAHHDALPDAFAPGVDSDRALGRSRLGRRPVASSTKSTETRRVEAISSARTPRRSNRRASRLRSVASIRQCVNRATVKISKAGRFTWPPPAHRRAGSCPFRYRGRP